MLAGGCRRDATSSRSDRSASGAPIAALGPQSATTGVTDTEIMIGEPAPFTGPSAGLGVEFWRGASAAFSEINDKGGVAGRRIRLVVADDGYDAERAAPAIVQLVDRDRVFLVFGGVGTPTIVRALPVVRGYFEETGLFYFANFTGAQPQRRPPNFEFVFNIRASYYEETAAIVHAYWGASKRRLGVFLQDHAYGIDGREGVVRALKEHGAELAGEARYARGQAFSTSAVSQVEILRSASVDAVIMVGSYQACGAFVRDARRAGWDVPITGVSFVGADQMLRLLFAEDSSGSLARRLMNTQVVPHYDDVSVAAVRDYRSTIDKYDPTAPPQWPITYRATSKYTFGSLEGYLSARALALVLQKTGRDLTRRTVYAAAESMGSFDLGLGVSAEFSPTRHQALDKVWFTHAVATGWEPTDQPVSLLK